MPDPRAETAMPAASSTKTRSVKLIDRGADVARAPVRAARREARLHEPHVPGIVEPDPVGGGQRVAAQKPLGDGVVLGVQAPTEDLERLVLADVLDARNVLDVPDHVA